MRKLAVSICLLSAFLFSCGGNQNKQTSPSTSEKPTETQAGTEIPQEISGLLSKYTCATCHKADEKLIGPAYNEVAQKGYSDAEIVNLVYNPKPENWPGYPPMPPQKTVPQEDAMKIAAWINSLK